MGAGLERETWPVRALGGNSDWPRFWGGSYWSCLVHFSNFRPLDGSFWSEIRQNFTIKREAHACNFHDQTTISFPHSNMYDDPNRFLFSMDQFVVQPSCSPYLDNHSRTPLYTQYSQSSSTTTNTSGTNARWSPKGVKTIYDLGPLL
jgi:hypothetical protein